MAKCIYAAPQIFVFTLSQDDVVRTSGESTKVYGNEGAWNSNWTPLDGDGEV